MKYDYHTIIIGSGLSGSLLAKKLATHHAKVLLIEKNKFGGKHLTSHYIGSKLFVNNSKKNKTPTSLSERYQRNYLATSEDIENYKGFFSQKELIKLGVEYKKGEPTIVDINSLTLDGKKITFKNLVLATGTRFEFDKTDLEQFDNEMILNGGDIWKNKDSYQAVLIKGITIESLELIQAYVNLGTKVYVINDKNNYLENYDSEYLFALKESLKKSNVEFFNDVVIESATYINNLKDIDVVIKMGNSVRVLNVNKVYLKQNIIANFDLLKTNLTFPKNDKERYITTRFFNLKDYINIYAIGSAVYGQEYENNSYYHANLLSKTLLKKKVKEFDFYQRTIQISTNKEYIFFGMNEQDIEKEQIKYNAFDTIFKNDLSAIHNEKTLGRIKVFFDKKHFLLGFALLAKEAREIADVLKLMAYNKIKVTSIIDLPLIQTSSLKLLQDFLIDYYYEFIEIDEKREANAKRKLNY